MNAADLVSRLSLLRDAPGGIKRLRELILQLAVQGKLVPQERADESAEILLERIREEKRRLVAEGKIKRDKPLPAIREVEKPYALPPGWVWVRLGEVSIINPRNDLDDDTVVSFIPMTLIPDGIFLDHGQEERSWRDVKTGFTHFAENDVSVAKITPCFENGKGCVFKGLTNGYGAGTTELHIVRPIGSTVESKYIHLFIKSPEFLLKGIPKMTGTAGQKRLPREYVAFKLFPLPPLAEQARIVAKVEALMRRCDALEERLGERDAALAASRIASLNALASTGDGAALKKSWDRVAANLRTLAADEAGAAELKRTILQLAVQGKLVPQDPADEGAEVLLERIREEKRRLIAEGKIKRDKPLPAIREDEKPYALPPGWVWASLGEVISDMDAGWSPNCPNDSASVDEWGVLKTTSVQPLLFLENENKLLPTHMAPRPELEVFFGDILITRAGPKNRVGVCCAVPKVRNRLMISDKIIRFHFVGDLINAKYGALSINAGIGATQIERMKTGMAESQMNISQDKLKNVFFALPPLAEQKRIVAKVEELMGLCDRLAGECRKERDCAERWAAAATAALTGIMEKEEEEKMRAPKTELVSSLTLKNLPSVKDDAPLAALLSRGGGEQNAKTLWQASGLEIDAFYRALKREMDSGWIAEDRKAAVRQTDGR